MNGKAVGYFLYYSIYYTVINSYPDGLPSNVSFLQSSIHFLSCLMPLYVMLAFNSESCPDRPVII